MPKQALQLAAEHPLAVYLMAELARIAGRLDEAEDHYHRLIKLL